MAPSPSVRSSDLRFALAVAALLVAVLVAHRLAIGAGFGVAYGEPAADGRVATGVIEFPEDNFAYLSHIAQAEAGAWSSINAFAWEEQAPIYCNPLFVLLGKLAAATGANASGMLQLAGLLAAAATVLAAHAIARRLGLGAAAARWTALLVAFGSGLSAYGAVLSPQGTDLLIGVDRTHQDTIAFSTFAVYPFQAVTLAVLALAVLAVARGARKTAGALALLSALLRPYECVLFAGSLAVFAVLSRDRDRLRTALVVALCIAPAFAYALWVGAQPAWRDYAEVTLARVDVSRVGWLVGYGAFLPAALLGAWVRRGEPAVRWLALWIGVLLVLLVGIDVAETKLASGAQLPLAVLAGAGLATLPRRRVTAVLAVALFAATPVHLLANVWSAHRLDAGLVRCAERLRAEGPAGCVLCDTATGRVLPGLASCRVVAGHWSMTPDYDGRRARLLAAGVEHDPRVRDLHPSREEFTRLLEDTGAAIMLLRADAPAGAFAATVGFAPVLEVEGWRLFSR